MNHEQEIKKLEAQIKELKQKIEAEKEAPPVWQPDHLRALKLIETIRRERYKAQGNWWPSEGETRHTICWSQLGNRAYINTLDWDFSSSVFGFWRNADVLIGVIKKYDPELWWYFTEYLPSIN